MDDNTRIKFYSNAEGLATQSIDMNGLFSQDVSASGSFNVRGMRGRTFGKLMNALPLSVLLVDKTCSIVFANDASARVGIDVDLIAGTPVTALFGDPSDGADVKALIREVLEDRTPRFTERYVGIPGEAVWGRIRLRSIRIAADRLILMLIEDLSAERRRLALAHENEETLRHHGAELEQRVRERTEELVEANERLSKEIAERRRAAIALRKSEERYRDLYQKAKQAEERLRRSEERYRQLVENANDIIYLTDEKGNFTFVNPVAVRLTGYSEEDLLGKPHLDLVLPGYKEEAEQFYARQRSDRIFDTYRETPILTRDGETIWLGQNVKLRTAEGEIVGFQAVARDITERKRAEEAVLAGERLSAVGQLAAGVAHNFNNLLQVMLGSAELGIINLDSMQLREAREHFSKIVEIAQFGADTVRRLQDFTSSSRRVGSEEQVFDLSRTIASAIETAEPVWKSNPERSGISVELKADLEDDCLIAGFRSEFFDIAHNLIKNSVEAMPDGGEIAVTTRRADDLVILTVKDTGVGLPEEKLGKVFEPFWTTKGFLATGMGLSSTLGIVKRHHGDITVESGPEGDFEVTIRLPAAGATLEETPVAQTPQAAQGLRILAADDMEAVLSMLEEGLIQHGHSVYRACSGEEALEIFARNEIDLVLCDLGMPGLTGWNVARAIKEECRRRGIPKPPFVLLTGWSGQDEDVHMMDEAGVDRVLVKPVDLSALGDLIADLCE